MYLSINPCGVTREKTLGLVYSRAGTCASAFTGLYYLVAEDMSVYTVTRTVIIDGCVYKRLCKRPVQDANSTGKKLFVEAAL